jgi:carbon-monoxide dehydrogenase small subunit
MSEKMEIVLEVNGELFEKKAYPMMRLLDFLREECRLTGSKEGCGEGECGACSVFLDDVLVNACLVPIFQAQGKTVTTVEGLANKEDLHPVQKAFLTYGGAQCGICTPGMLMASVDLLRKVKKPSREQIKMGLSGNLCRCTGYMKIFDSVEQASQEMN